MSTISWAESTARARVAHLLDHGSFAEILPPQARVMSPHLAQLGVPAAFDDGVVVGRGRLDGRPVLLAAQEGAFMGGGVGEVHGAKLVGLFRLALAERPAAVLVLAESGGVRLHEANAGLIAVSEVMRALLDVRAAGIPVVMLIGGAYGCFGGMGLVGRCADHVVISDVGRHAMSGPEVIESSHGVEEFDSRDRALVWRTTGGKHRWLCGDADLLVEDDVAAFRAAAQACLGVSRPLTLQVLLDEHALLRDRLRRAGDAGDARVLWSRLGVGRADEVPELDVATLQVLRPVPQPPAADTASVEALRGLVQATPGAPGHEAAAVDVSALLERLFEAGPRVQVTGELLHGEASARGRVVTVVGTGGHAAIGVELALAQAAVVLDTLQRHPGRPIVLLVDTQGQRLRRRDEMLGIHRAMAHLGCVLDLARRRGHRVVGLVYDQALSGGFITSGLMADACHALPQAEIRVMRLPAMARVTKLDETLLATLAQANPVFAPGVDNYVAMGGVRSLWQGDLQAALAAALDDDATDDRRAADGAARGGRTMAARVIADVAAG